MHSLTGSLPVLLSSLVLAACGGREADVSPDAATEGPSALEGGPGGDRIVEVRVGCQGYCVRTASGRVECPQADASARTVVDAGAVALSVGGTFVYHDELLACALLAGGRVACADPPRTDTFDAVVPGASAVSVGYMPPCAVTTAGTVACALASGASSPWQTVAGITGATAVSVGEDFACAMDGAGAVRCWGHLLPEGGFASEAVSPWLVPLPEPAAAIAAGFRGACALAVDGTAECWGANGSGDVVVAPGVPGIAIDVDEDVVCVLDASHHVRCTVAGAAVTPALGAVTQMDVGGRTVCGLDADGGVECVTFP